LTLSGALEYCRDIAPHHGRRASRSGECGILERMRRFLACTASAAALVLFGAAPAYASHAFVAGTVRVEHNGSIVSAIGERAACSATTCSVTITLSKRDYRRFVRWCGSTSQTVTVPSGQTSAVTSCAGPSTWSIKIFALSEDSNLDLTTHPSDVVVTVNVST
jgi:hypothetical protein